MMRLDKDLLIEEWESGLKEGTVEGQKSKELSFSNLVAGVVLACRGGRKSKDDDFFEDFGWESFKEVWRFCGSFVGHVFENRKGRRREARVVPRISLLI